MLKNSVRLVDRRSMCYFIFSHLCSAFIDLTGMIYSHTFFHCIHLDSFYFGLLYISVYFDESRIYCVTQLVQRLFISFDLLKPFSFKTSVLSPFFLIFEPYFSNVIHVRDDTSVVAEAS